ncbi:MAG: sugar phosphate isomerase/epimerase family protein [Pirellulaceae bacterium]
MKPAIAQVCTLLGSLETDVEDFAAGHCPAMELYWSKVETYLKEKTVSQLLDLLHEHSMDAPVASFQGGLLASQGGARREAWALFADRLRLCCELGVRTMVVQCDVPPPLDAETIDRVRVSLTDAARQAADCGVQIAIEPQATSALAKNIQTAAVLVSEVDSDSLGICLDVFHFYTGCSKYSDLNYLTTENLFHVQVSDLADVPREFAQDADRIMPGDGDIPLDPIVAHLRSIEYKQYVSLELLNPKLWQIPALQIGEIGMTALRRLLGQASMD